MQQPMNTNPVQVVVVAQPMMIDKQIKYRNMKTSLARQLIGLGIMQLIIGILCIIFQGVAVGIYTYQYSVGYSYSSISGIDFVGHGFWTGILFLITGPFGIAGGVKRKRCQVVAFSVLSILSALFAACLIGIAIAGALFYGVFNLYNYCRWVSTTSNYNSNPYNSDCYTRESETTGLAMEAMMAILGLMEFIIAIRSSVICCKIGACCCNCGGSCCCPPSPLQNQLLMAGQPFPGQQQIIIANQQQSGSNQPHMFIPNQPSAFVPNSHQQLMYLPNQQQPVFLVNPQQPIVNADPQQQRTPYQTLPPKLPPYGQQSSAYTSLARDPKDQRSDDDGAYIYPQ